MLPGMDEAYFWEKYLANELVDAFHVQSKTNFIQESKNMKNTLRDKSSSLKQSDEAALAPKIANILQKVILAFHAKAKNS